MYKVKAQVNRTAYCFRHSTEEITRVAHVKATKQKANPALLMRFAWKNETMVLPDHKVEITEQLQDC